MGIRSKVRGFLSLGTAAIAIMGANHAEAQTPPSATLSQPNQPGSIDTPIFARFSDLDAQNTRDKLDDLTASKELSATLQTLVKQLDAGASSRELERHVMPLIAKQGIADVDVTLAAIMRLYYLNHLQQDLADGKLNRNEVFSDLISTDQALTTAAVGPTVVRANKTRR